MSVGILYIYTSRNESFSNMIFVDVHHIGDEFHYMFTCSFFTVERQLYLRPCFYQKSSSLIMYNLMNSLNHKTLINLCKFIEVIVANFK
jgi:hypothetical protein